MAAPLAAASVESAADVRRRNRPPLDQLLPAAARALERELGRLPDRLSVIASSRRTWSSVWELRSGPDQYILKWLPLRAQRELELTRAARDVFAGAPFVRSARVACCPTPDTFLVEKLPGEHLQNLCSAPPWLTVSRWIDGRCDLLTRVGRWLAGFHGASLEAGSSPLAGVRAYVSAREGAFPSAHRPLYEALWRAIDSGRATATVRVHGDFTPHNVLATADSISVIDLAGISEFERETRWFDVACMVVGLEENWRRRRTNHLKYFGSYSRAMVSSFLEGYGARVDDPILPICYAVRHFGRIATHFRRTGRQPGARDWHVGRLRLALQRPDQIWRGV
jgi:hypothetical protein